MFGHIDDDTDEFPDELSQSNAMTPAGNQLFEVDVNGERLDQECAKVFHRIVAMLLFACKCICPDIQVTFAFLLFTRNHKVGPR